MAMKRICDLCGCEMMDKGYQFTVPSVLIDNKGIEPIDSSMTDVCDKCVLERGDDIIAYVVKKAEGK